MPPVRNPGAKSALSDAAYARSRLSPIQSTFASAYSYIIAVRTWTASIREITMLRFAVVFLVIALVAAVFGFGGFAAGAVEIAKILFFVFVLMAVVTFIVGLVRNR